MNTFIRRILLGLFLSVIAPASYAAQKDCRISYLLVDSPLITENKLEVVQAALKKKGFQININSASRVIVEFDDFSKSWFIDSYLTHKNQGVMLELNKTRSSFLLAEIYGYEVFFFNNNNESRSIRYDSDGGIYNLIGTSTPIFRYSNTEKGISGFVDEYEMISENFETAISNLPTCEELYQE